MIYINANVSCRELKSNIFEKEMETFSHEFSLRNWKWLCIGLYEPPNS